MSKNVAYKANLRQTNTFVNNLTVRLTDTSSPSMDSFASQIPMVDPNPPAASFLRLAKSWVLLPCVAYLIAIPLFQPAALFVPYLVWEAPLGVISYFTDFVKFDTDPRGHQTLIKLSFHVVFWSLLMIGLMGRKSLPLGWLRLIWCILVLTLFMSVSGCSTDWPKQFRGMVSSHLRSHE